MKRSCNSHETPPPFCCFQSVRLEADKTATNRIAIVVAAPSFVSLEIREKRPIKDRWMDSVSSFQQVSNAILVVEFRFSSAVFGLFFFVFVFLGCSTTNELNETVKTPWKPIDADAFNKFAEMQQWQLLNNKCAVSAAIRRRSQWKRNETKWKRNGNQLETKAARITSASSGAAQQHKRHFKKEENTHTHTHTHTHKQTNKEERIVLTNGFTSAALPCQKRNLIDQLS